MFTDQLAPASTLHVALFDHTRSTEGVQSARTLEKFDHGTREEAFEEVGASTQNQAFEEVRKRVDFSSACASHVEVRRGA